MMKVISTDIADVKLIQPKVFGDERGFLIEVWQRERFAKAGIDVEFVQDNQSQSVEGTLRGLHYQIQQPQGKLVRVTTGEVFDVAVDLRRSSATFGRWVSQYLSEDNNYMMWVPPGFAHGFYVTSKVAVFQYKCTDYYAPEHERCLRWNDPEVGIEWPLAMDFEPRLSEKDRMGASLSDVEAFA